jgi:hypothetical protein
MAFTASCIAELCCAIPLKSNNSALCSHGSCAPRVVLKKQSVQRTKIVHRYTARGLNLSLQIYSSSVYIFKWNEGTKTGRLPAEERRISQVIIFVFKSLVFYNSSQLQRLIFFMSFRSRGSSLRLMLLVTDGSRWWTRFLFNSDAQRILSTLAQATRLLTCIQEAPSFEYGQRVNLFVDFITLLIECRDCTLNFFPYVFPLIIRHHPVVRLHVFWVTALLNSANGTRV